VRAIHRVTLIFIIRGRRSAFIEREEHIRAECLLYLHRITATGFAVVGDAMTLTAGERTAIQAKIVDDATPFHGASIAVIRAFGAPPSAAANAAKRFRNRV
jgi:hypothetical protein